eukprot:6176031-Pleurochrysis_carterae.AAC.1
MQRALLDSDKEWQELEQEAAYAVALASDTSSEEDAEDRYCRVGRKDRAGGWHRHPRNGSLRADATPGEQYRFESHKSPWWRCLNDPTMLDPSSAAGRKFWGKFRVPRKLFDDLLQQTIDSGLFPTKAPGERVFGPCPHLLCLKILGALRYMATGADFTLVEE